jgi:Uncharacterized protein conserved in bacteria
MSLAAGTTVRLETVREAPPNGFILTDGERSVLLPYGEIAGERPNPGDLVEVFLFHDTLDRLTATTRKPLLRLGGVARLKVADAHPRYGCFLEMGLGRQLLLPNAELPRERELRLLPGDEVFVRMAHDKSGRIIAELAEEADLEKLTVSAPAAWFNRTVRGWVTRLVKAGAFVFVEGEALRAGVLGLIPHSEQTRPLRLGEAFEARVTYVRDDGRVNLSMRPRKEIGREEDAGRILAYLRGRNTGAMPYSDETPPDVIRRKFGISKAAFKRALGKLMREGVVRQEGSWTYLNDQQDQP